MLFTEESSTSEKDMSDSLVPLFFGRVSDEGKLVFDSEERRLQYREWMNRLRGSQVQVSVRKRRKKRSLKQNNYLWKCLSVLEESTGQAAEDIYDYLIERHAPMEELDLSGRKVMKRKGSSRFSTGEMVEFMMHVSVLASELGVVLPDPDQYDPAVLLNEE